MAAALGEAEMDLPPAPLGMERGAAARARRREGGRADLGLQPVGPERAGDAVDDEGGPGRIVELLELAAAAGPGNACTAATGGAGPGERAVGAEVVAGGGERHVAAVGGDAVAARRDADDLVVVHRHSPMARGI